MSYQKRPRRRRRPSMRRCVRRMPYVCPGCYAVGSEPCVAWCPDRQAEERREECQASSEDVDLEYDENGDVVALW